MTSGPEELEELLGNVRKTISDNERFLRTLLEDSVETGNGFASDDNEEGKEEEGFEEL